MTAKEAREIAENKRAKMIRDWTPSIIAKCDRILTKYIPKLVKQGEHKYNDLFFAPKKIEAEVEKIFKNCFEPLGYKVSYAQGIIVIEW